MKVLSEMLSKNVCHALSVCFPTLIEVSGDIIQKRSQEQTRLESLEVEFTENYCAMILIVE